MLHGLEGFLLLLCMFCFFGVYTFSASLEGSLHRHLCCERFSVRVAPCICQEKQARPPCQQEAFISSSSNRLCTWPGGSCGLHHCHLTRGADPPKPPFLVRLRHAFHQLSVDAGGGVG